MKKKGHDASTSNIENDSEEERIKPKDAVSTCIFIAQYQVTSQDTLVVASDEFHPIFETAKDYRLDSVGPGWARRLRGESLYGETYMTADYRARIGNLFDVGGRDKSQKKSPGEMREIIQNEKPLDLKIPTDSAIFQVVSLLSQKKKKNEGNEEDEDDAMVNRWDKLNNLDNKLLENVIDEFPTSMPESLYKNGEKELQRKTIMNPILIIFKIRRQSREGSHN